MHVEAFFPEAVRAEVALAVRRAESGTRGQIVPVVVERSDSYPEVRFRGGLLLAAAATAAALLLRLPVGPSELVLLQVAAGALGALVSLLGPVERLLAGRRAMEEAVRARAVRAFHEEGLQRIAEGTGVLVFASLFERQAVVLGDHGIHGKVGDDEWGRALSALLAGVRAGKPGQGFVGAVELCGEWLRQHFPRDPAGGPAKNELEDGIRVERS